MRDRSLGTETVHVRRLHFTNAPESAKVARRLVAGLLAGYDAAEVADAQLIASELVTNAVQYAGGGKLVARRYTDRLRIEVSDLNSDTVAMGNPDTASPSGRGLQIVAAVARAWGVRRENGKIVWAELALSGRL